MNPTHPKGLCVFDIDNTILRGPASSAAVCGGTDMPTDVVCPGCDLDTYKDLYAAPYAKQAIAACLANNFAVAVATGESCGLGGPTNRPSIPSRLSFLRDLGMPPDVVSSSLVAGPSLQCAPTHAAHGDKEIMVRGLMKRFNVAAKDTYFFDDDTKFRAQVARIPGVHIGTASDNCAGVWCPEGCGLTKENFKKIFPSASS